MGLTAERASQVSSPISHNPCTILGCVASFAGFRGVLLAFIRAATIKRSYVGNRLGAQEAIDFFARGVIKVEKFSELTQVFQLLEEG